MAVVASKRRVTLEELLICSLCLDFFKSPKFLPCLHRYCTDCLIKYKAMCTRFCCPLCNTEYEKITSFIDIKELKDDILFGIFAKEKENGFTDVSKANHYNQIKKQLFCSECNSIQKEPWVLPCFRTIYSNCFKRDTILGIMSCLSICFFSFHHVFLSWGN